MVVMVVGRRLVPGARVGVGAILAAAWLLGGATGQVEAATVTPYQSNAQSSCNGGCQVTFPKIANNTTLQVTYVNCGIDTPQGMGLINAVLSSNNNTQFGHVYLIPTKVSSIPGVFIYAISNMVSIQLPAGATPMINLMIGTGFSSADCTLVGQLVGP